MSDKIKIIILEYNFIEDNITLINKQYIIKDNISSNYQSLNDSIDNDFVLKNINKIHDLNVIKLHSLEIDKDNLKTNVILRIMMPEYKFYEYQENTRKKFELINSFTKKSNLIIEKINTNNTNNKKNINNKSLYKMCYIKEKEGIVLDIKIVLFIGINECGRIIPLENNNKTLEIMTEKEEIKENSLYLTKVINKNKNMLDFEILYLIEKYDGFNEQHLIDKTLKMHERLIIQSSRNNNEININLNDVIRNEEIRQMILNREPND